MDSQVTCQQVSHRLARYRLQYYRTLYQKKTIPLAKDRLLWVTLGAVTGYPKVRPEAHIFPGPKAPWYEITDNLPQFEEWQPEDSEFIGRFD